MSTPVTVSEHRHKFFNVYLEKEKEAQVYFASGDDINNSTLKDELGIAAFNAVCEHLFMQMYAASSNTGCVYRGKDSNNSTTKCAVGVLIPDDVYCNDMEGQSVRQLVGHNNTIALVIKLFPNMCDRLQHVHDNYFPSEKFGYKLSPYSSSMPASVVPVHVRATAAALLNTIYTMQFGSDSYVVSLFFDATWVDTGNCQHDFLNLARDHATYNELSRAEGDEEH